MSENKKKDWQKIIDDSEHNKKPDKKRVKSESKEKLNMIEHHKYKDLEEKLTIAEQKVSEHLDAVLRTRAEMENVRRRAERDVANAHKYGLDRFVPELLPVIDSLERGFESCDSDDEVLINIRHGMQLTIEMFLKILSKFGVEQINPLGEDFNPDLHEAMSVKNDPNVKPNIVVSVLQKGYQLNGRLLRPALVVVSSTN